MKSPVFGLGRNWYHRATSSPRHPAAANINLKGKKAKSMSCGCCVCIDMRSDYAKKLHMREMREA